MFRRAAPTVAMVGVLVGAAIAALGRPDLGGARDLLSGAASGTTAVLALVGILAWVIIAVVAVVAVSQAVRTVHVEAGIAQTRWGRALLFLVTGVTVLVIGAVHHVATSASLCCGSAAEAGQLVH